MKAKPIVFASERKRSEEVQHESELWRQLTEALPQLVWAATPDGACDYFSTQWSEYTDVPESELLGWRWLDVLHPDDREPTRRSWMDSVAGRAPYDVEYRVRRSDGVYGWFKTRGVPIRDSEGNIVKWFGTCTDITDQKQAEDALRQSEQELRQARNMLEIKVAERTTELRRTAAYLMEAQKLSHTGSFGWDVSTGELYFSAETSRIFEYEASTKITLPLVLERVHPEDRTIVQETLDRAVHERRSLDFEFRLLMPDGSVKHLHVVAHTVGEEPGNVEFIGAVMNVTAQKSSRQALEKAFQEMQTLKDRFRLSVDTIPGLVWSTLPDGSTEFLNQRWMDYTGLSVKGAGDWTIAAHPEDRARLANEWRAALTSGQALETEGRLRRADGEYRWFLIRSVPLYDEAGSIVKWYGKSSDIEDRKRAEAQLRESEQRYRRLVDTASEGILVCNEYYITTFVNQRMAEMLGYEPEEMVGLKISDYLFEEGHADLEERIVARRRGIAERYEQMARRKDGCPLWVYISATPVFDAEHNFQGSFCMLSDITQRKLAEEGLQEARAELARVSRVTMMGELAASIAHEVNQPLAGVVASANAGLNWLAKNPPNLLKTREAIKRILRDGNRAGEVLNRIRTLLKKTSPTKTRVSMNQIVRDVMALTGDELRKQNVAFSMELDSSLAPIMGDSIQLQQVLLNLIRNANEAMAGIANRRKTLRIRSELGDLDGRPAVSVKVSDTGVGFSPTDAGRLFEAFHTTKPEGMGMGLWISRAIIERHGGRLTAQSNDGPGATFQVLLPAEAGDSE
ncbi:MAG: PAS domain-containing protein [Verrucomicrobiota bacterium]|jgi:PAS domain S-box-containing protein